MRSRSPLPPQHLTLSPTHTCTPIRPNPLLGVHRDTPAALRADFALFSTSFHDDMQLGGDCDGAPGAPARGGRDQCQCTSVVVGSPGDGGAPGYPANLTFSQVSSYY